MFNVGDEIVVKTFDVLVKEGKLEKAADLENVYWNKQNKFVVFPDFNFYGQVSGIKEIDENDKDMPYFLDLGIWVPEFLIEKKEKKEEKPIPEKAEVPKNDNEEKVWINKYTNKPFGKLFIKLIKLDEVIAEFSNTSFSKLKKHELQYIAKVLKDNGRKMEGYENMTQKELSMLCYSETLAL